MASLCFRPTAYQYRLTHDLSPDLEDRLPNKLPLSLKNRQYDSGYSQGESEPFRASTASELQSLFNTTLQQSSSKLTETSCASRDELYTKEIDMCKYDLEQHEYCESLQSSSEDWNSKWRAQLPKDDEYSDSFQNYSDQQFVERQSSPSQCSNDSSGTRDDLSLGSLARNHFMGAGTESGSPEYETAKQCILSKVSAPKPDLIPKEEYTESQVRERSGLFDELKSYILNRIVNDVVRLDLRNQLEGRGLDEDDIFVKDDYLRIKQKWGDDETKNKRPRRPRKLPEIPTNHPRNSKMSRSSTMEKSIAEELMEADPNVHIVCGTPVMRIPVPGDVNCPAIDPKSGDNSLRIKDELEDAEEDFDVIDKHLKGSGVNLVSGESEYRVERLAEKEKTGGRFEVPKVLAVDQKTALRSSQNEDWTKYKKEIKRSDQPRWPPRQQEDCEDLEITHRGCHKFIPRHCDEIFIEIGDPLHVYKEEEDLWCEGVNLKTKNRGIFPSAYATDLSLFRDEEETAVQQTKFTLRFLGSVEVNYHTGSDVICQAIKKIVRSHNLRRGQHSAPLCYLDISDFGIRMTDCNEEDQASDISQTTSTRDRVAMLLTRHKQNTKDPSNNFFPLTNVSYFGSHPRLEKYFAFITKHPSNTMFACHVFQSDKSTKRLVEVVRSAFQNFFKQYMTFVHPTEDIYLE